jgi:hypothetical protein
MWHDIRQCILWILDVIGQPGKEGLYKRGSLLQVDDVYGGETFLELSGATRTATGGDKVSAEAAEELDRMTLSMVSRFDKIPPASHEVVLREYQSNDEPAQIGGPYELCWTSLIDRSYIAPYRLPFAVFTNLDNCGKGLRASFDLLVSIAGVERAVLRDGLVLTGLSTALIPINVICERPRWIQWHLIEFQANDDRFRSLHDREEFWDMIPRERLIERDLGNLKGIGCLGWFQEVVISHTPNQVTYSSLSQIDHKWRASQTQIQAGGQVSIPGGVGLQTHISRNWGKVSLALRFPASSLFSRRIEELYGGSVFIYDDGRETAWLCSTIDLIILMLRYYLSRNGFPDPLAFQDRVASAQQHTESMKGLMRLKLDEVVRPGHPAGDLTYGALITEFSEKFGSAFGRLIGVLRGHASDEILGFDFLELVSATPDGVILPKQLQVKASVGAWSSLVGNADVVFCKGLGDVIRPRGSVTRRICQYIQRPLSGSNLLVCPVYLLKRPLEQQGCTFHNHFIAKSNRYKWVFRGNPF